MTYREFLVRADFQAAAIALCQHLISESKNPSVSPQKPSASGSPAPVSASEAKAGAASAKAAGASMAAKTGNELVEGVPTAAAVAEGNASPFFKSSFG